jgi:hypothetical protein
MSGKRQELLDAIEAVASQKWDLPTPNKNVSVPMVIIHADHAKALVDAAKIGLAIIDRAMEIPPEFKEVGET